ncbi:MAG: DUF1223 domain-containing protein [Pseudomonadota bacterium]
MRISLLALTVILSVLMVLSLRGGAQTLQDLPAARASVASPIVAELFTSQSCSSCPPAEKLFAELAERDDLIILEWHVDYWDTLIHGRAGAWKDPYSSPAYTARQRQYNRALRRTGSVYTPQAVINGSSESVGSRRADVEAILTPARHATTEIDITAHNDALQVKIGALSAPLARPAEIYQVTLLPEQSTSVPRGENRGVRLFSRNVVLDMAHVGSYSGTGLSLDIPPPQAGQTCAVIIQEKRGNRLGPILGAQYCS